MPQETTETKPQENKRDNLTIGGSRIAAVMGMSRWQSPLALWAEMTGRVERDDLSSFERMEIGTELEEYVAAKFTRKTGKRLRRNRRTLVHPKYPYMVGHPDRWVDSEDALFEAKTTGEFRKKEWDGDQIPIEYLHQLNWYLGLLNRKIGYFAVLIGGNKFVWKEIAFSQKLFDQQVEAARVFMEEFVLKDTPPMAGPDDSEILMELYPVGAGKAELDENQAEMLEALLIQRKNFTEQIEKLEQKKSEAQAKAEQILAGSESAETESYVVTWKNQKTTRVDTEKLKAAGMYEEFSKITESRVFRPSLKKTGEKKNA